MLGARREWGVPEDSAKDLHLLPASPLASRPSRQSSTAGKQLG